jgi:hypothetical protein
MRSTRPLNPHPWYCCVHVESLRFEKGNPENGTREGTTEFEDQLNEIEVFQQTRVSPNSASMFIVEERTINRGYFGEEDSITKAAVRKCRGTIDVFATITC